MAVAYGRPVYRPAPVYRGPAYYGRPYGGYERAGYGYDRGYARGGYDRHYVGNKDERRMSYGY